MGTKTNARKQETVDQHQKQAEESDDVEQENTEETNDDKIADGKATKKVRFLCTFCTVFIIVQPYL